MKEIQGKGKLDVKKKQLHSCDMHQIRGAGGGGIKFGMGC